MRKLLFAFIALAWLPCASQRGTAQQLAPYGHTVWQTEQGLPQNTVQAILQTRDGYLWIGTRDGLARFDGWRFVTFDKRTTPGLPHNEIRHLYEDRAGRLWISTAGGLAQYHEGKFTTFSLPGDRVWSVVEDGAGVVWAATPNGALRLQDGKFVLSRGASTLNAASLLADRAGQLWMSTPNGLARMKDGVEQLVEEFTGQAVKALFEDRGGQLWLGTTDGLSLFAEGQWQRFKLKQPVNAVTQDTLGNVWIGTVDGLLQFSKGQLTRLTTREGLPDNRVVALRADRRGGLWIGTPGGVAHWQNGSFANFTEREGLSSNLVLALYADREDNLWVGTEAGGLNLLKRKKFMTYTRAQGLSANLTRAVLADRHGALWVATSAGLNRFNDGRWTTLTTKDGLASDDVISLCDDRAGNVWIGTAAGLQRYQQGALKTYTMKDGLTDDSIRSLYEDRAGNLWIGTRRGVTRWRDGQFESFTTLDGLPSDVIGAFCASRNGTLWIGTQNGLSRFAQNTFTNFELNEAVLALHEDAAGTLWIGTHGGGLLRYQNNQFAAFTLKDGLPDDVIYAVIEKQGSLWMSSNKGVFRVSRDELAARQAGEARLLNVVAYDTADGLETRECSGGSPAACQASDGRLWFATIKGAAVIDPAHLPRNDQPPPVALEQITVDGAAFSLFAPLTLPPGKSRIEFAYAGLSFAAPQQVTFKYKLEGFDQNWIDAGARRSVAYTNIPAGSYRFRVLACNSDGVWNETGASFAFTLKPYFYQTRWFAALGLMSLGLLAFAAYRLRVRRIEREFAAVLAERNRLAREIHDTLAQGFTGISVQLELVKRLLERAPQVAQTHLEQAQSLARASLAEARRSVWDLRSPALESHDLPAALKETAQRLTAGTPVQARVEVSGVYRRLSRAIEDHLLRIGQEALTNAIKHAQASRVELQLAFEPQRLRFSVRDDGRGFDTAAVPSQADGHFGLLGMRERVAQLGGSLALNSRPNEGAEVVIEIPLNG
jgi:ligand-binding sensor domain-containing protein/signal transduction histidine kinase